MLQAGGKTAPDLEQIEHLQEFLQGIAMPQTMEGLDDLDNDQMFVLPGSISDDKRSFALSTKAILSNILNLQEAWGSKGIPGQGDGTWSRILYSWPLIAIGSHTLRHDTKNNCVTHSFVPVAFVVSKSENGFRC